MKSRKLDTSMIRRARETIKILQVAQYNQNAIVVNYRRHIAGNKKWLVRDNKNYYHGKTYYKH